jgi:hypothetical protein
MRIINPFTQTISVVITQPLPSLAQIVDYNNATLISTATGPALTWQRSISPSSAIELTYTAKLGGAPGSIYGYPAAELLMQVEGEQATFTSNAPSFTGAAPLQGKTSPPVKLNIGEQTRIPVTISNLTSQPVSPIVSVSLIELTGGVVASNSQGVTALGNSDVSTDLLITAPLKDGQYVLHIEATLGNTIFPIYDRFVRVEATKQYMPVVRR